MVARRPLSSRVWRRGGDDVNVGAATSFQLGVVVDSGCVGIVVATSKVKMFM